MTARAPGGRLSPGAATLLSVALAGCTMPPAPFGSRDPRVVIAPDAKLVAGPPIVTRGDSGLEVSLELENPTPSDMAVLVTTDWFDAAGRPVETVMSLPRRVTVPRFADSFVRGIAPTTSVSGFRIHVEPDPAIGP